ncbi:MAG: AAA family ATPase [Chloroflexota bacterium]
MQSYTPLVTVVGTGGMGKTRLSLALAEQLLDDQSHQGPRQFPNGIFFVPLASLNDPEQIVLAVAEALHFPLESGGQGRRTAKQQVLDYLRKKQLLLILDNFEHLLDGVGLISEIMQTAVHVQLLITSRERLQLQGEQVFPIEGLVYPQSAGKAEDVEAYTAVQLFLQAAQRVQPDFSLQVGELSHLAHICELVGGMPLGLELAASWVDILPIAEIANEIQRSSNFLETELRDVPERHRSMRVVFAASWQRLSADEQAAFAKLSVFRGGFTRRAAQAVTGATLRILVRLVSKSLLQYDREQDRYQIHELLRQFGAEQLAAGGEETAVSHQHSQFYCTFLHEHEPDIKGAQQQNALLEIELEMGNIQKAWRWAAVQSKVALLALGMDSLGYFLEWNGRFQEGLALFQAATEALLDKPINGVKPKVARLLGWQSAFANIVQDSETAVNLCEQAVSLLPSEVDTRREEAFILYQMSRISADYEQKKEALKRSLQLHRETNNSWGVANTLHLLGDPDVWYGTAQEIEDWLEECLAIRRKLGDQQGIAQTLIYLSILLRYQGGYVRSEQMAQQALQICQDLDVRSTEARALYNWGQSLGHLAKFEEGNAVLRKTEELYKELENPFWLAVTYFALTLNALCRNKLQEARAYSELFDKTFPAGAFQLVGNNLSQILVIEGKFEEALLLLYDNDVHLSPPHRGYSIRILYVALAEFGCQRLDQAKLFAYRSLQNAVALKIHIDMQHAFVAIIVLFSALGEVERAVELDALSRRGHPLVDKGWSFDEVKRPFFEKIATLPPETIAAARERGRQLDYWQTAESLLSELTERGWGEIEANLLPPQAPDTSTNSG